MLGRAGEEIRWPPSLATRILLRTARFRDNPLGWYLEWLLAIIFAPIALRAAGVVFDLIGLWALVSVAVFVQFIVFSSWASSPVYALYLAKRAAAPPRLRTFSDVSSHLIDFRSHMRAMKRLGGIASGFYVDDFLLSGLSEHSWQSENRPRSFDELANAIGLGLAAEAASVPPRNLRDPFVRYADALERSFTTAPFTLDQWRRFLVSRYEALPERIRLLAAEHRPRSFAERFREWIELWKILAYVILTIIAILFGTRIAGP